MGRVARTVGELADVNHRADRELTAKLRGDRADLFAAGRALAGLGVLVGDRVLVENDFETVAADVVAIDPDGALRLRLLAPLGKADVIRVRSLPASLARGSR